ncbi:DUF2194 domain-containing protein [Mesonia aquimarina]|uniref:DUF2194 domain-containing protein n=1 Tax=Mesonia aquimarina TaxID=1504967 RepID=UPI0013CEAB58|nr:DUF2194 domain-containing protein [Mesonia aquimarina]
MCSISCQEDDGKILEPESIDRVVFDPVSENPLVTYLVNNQNPQSITCNKQIRKALDYAKIPFGKISLENFNQDAKIPKTSRVVVIYDLKPLSNKAMESVVQFVASGGTLFLPNTTENKRFGFLSGIKQNADYAVTQEPQGYFFNIPYLPNFKERPYQNKVPHYGLTENNFSNRVDIWATSFTDKSFPLIIKNNLGKGKVIAFNTTQYAEKEDRGLFFSAILAGLEGVPYPVANVSTIFLDDFPAPMYNIKKENIKSEMNITQSEYYREVWWPDMLQLAEDENLIYSTYLCFDYRNLTDPPFLFKEWESNTFIKEEKEQAQSGWLAREVRKSKHDLDLHGYNHVSLTKEEWPNKAFMVSALKSARKKWKAGRYGKLPITYVPPSNIIDSLGLAALEEGMPSLRYNCSIYMGDFEEGGAREFDPEPFNDHFFNFPRITSGYVFDDAEEFNQQSLYLYTGIWTHFLHPDDVYQVADESNKLSAGNYEFRNKLDLGWRISKDGSPGLLPRFQTYLQETKARFPLMNFYSVKEGAEITEKWRNTSYKHQQKEKFYQVTGNQKIDEQQSWFTYIAKEHQKELETYLEKKQWKFSKTELLQGYLFTVNTSENKIEIPLFLEDKENTAVQSVLEDYKNYTKDSLVFENNREKINHYIAEEKVDKAIAVLKQEINQEKNTDQKQIRELNKYLGWESRNDEIWPILEKKYTQNPSTEIVALSKVIAQESFYPTEAIEKKWLEREIKFNPDNIELKQQYDQHFQPIDNSKLSTTQQLQLLQNTENKDDKATYFATILYSNQEKALQIVDTLQPCSNFLTEELITDIIWIYADKENYKEAVKWSNCVNTIPKETKEEWRIQLGEYKFLKEENYSRYISYLLEHKPLIVTQELINETPCKNKDLVKQAYSIAYAFGDQGTYRKALAWSNCAENFPVKDKILWYYELQDLENVQKVYDENIATAKNPEELKATLAEIYLYSDNLYNSAELTTSLPKGKEKNDLKEKINKEIIYTEIDIQEKIVQDFPELIDEKISEDIQKKSRVNTNDFIETKSSMIADRLQPTSLGNKVGYGIRDNAANTHTFGLTQYKAYALQIDQNYTNNIDQNLYGVEYTFNRKERNEKLNYGGLARVEFNEASKAFFHLQTNVSFAKDSLFNSVQLLIRPAITGPAYTLDIYQTQLNIYEEMQFDKHWRGILNLETNYYSDDVIDGMLLANIGYGFKIQQQSTLLPYTEISGMLGSDNREDGYPYWTIKERLYGGIGLDYMYIDPKSELKFSLGAATFLDTFSESFQRFRGEINYPVLPYFYLTGNAEFYTLKNFYSNNFQLGLRYYLKSK